MRRPFMMWTLLLLSVLQGATGQEWSDPKPDDIPEGWKSFLGEYVSGIDTLLVAERGGSLGMLAAPDVWYPITPLYGDTMALRSPTEHEGKWVVFERQTEGRVGSLQWGRRQFLRPDDGLTVSGKFRLAPRRSYDDLLATASASSPPSEQKGFRSPDLVELRSLDSTIRYDIRYATTDNFMGMRMYAVPRALLQRPAAEALVRAHHWLRAHGYGLIIFDGYRPWLVTRMFWDATPEELRSFVADPSKGSRHNRGCAVDVSLYHLDDGRAADMVSGYDEFTPRAYPSYPGGTSLQRWHRSLLKTAMEAHGFDVYPWEWWHFDFREWRSYPIGNRRLEDLSP